MVISTQPSKCIPYPINFKLFKTICLLVDERIVVKSHSQKTVVEKL